MQTIIVKIFLIYAALMTRYHISLLGLRTILIMRNVLHRATPSASLEVIKHNLSYLKEALALIKAKIDADTKELFN